MIVRPFVLTLCVVAAAEAQQQSRPPSPVHPDTPKPSAITKLTATTFRIGDITIDTAAKTLSVTGTVNEASTLEFLANTVQGRKAYESALTLNTNAVSFNAALLLLGLDHARSKPSSVQFDPAAPEGDPVELTVTWTDGGKPRMAPIEELLFDQRANRTFSKGPWVYTGSRFYDTGELRFYLAEQDGVLIGFMHGPQSIIDNPRADAIGGFGYLHLESETGTQARRRRHGDGQGPATNQVGFPRPLSKEKARPDCSGRAVGYRSADLTTTSARCCGDRATAWRVALHRRGRTASSMQVPEQAPGRRPESLRSGGPGSVTGYRPGPRRSTGSTSVD